MTNVKKFNNTNNQISKPSFDANMPAVVRYDSKLSFRARVLYSEIRAMTNKEGFCWATNRYFAELYQVRKETISRDISSLENRGYIRIEIIRDSDTKQVLRRKIYLTDFEGVLTKRSVGVMTKQSLGVDEMIKENTTSKNTTSINKDTVDFIDISVAYLNEQTNSNFRTSTPKTKSLLKTLKRSGYTLKDIKTVIRFKTSEWHNDPKMSKFLRPATLFNQTKFESYLNAAKKQTDRPDNKRENMGELYDQI